MLSLVERETLLVNVLRDALPGWRVRGVLGARTDPAQAGIVRPPELQLAAAEWQPPVPGRGQGGGGQVWIARLLCNELRGLDVRRTGSETARGLLPTLEAVRERLAGLRVQRGASPLVPLGGSFPAQTDSVAIWEERFLESFPAPDHALPALASELEPMGTLDAALDAWSNAIPDMDFEVGDLVIIEDAEADVREFVGEVMTIEDDVAAFERPVSRDFAMGSVVRRATQALHFPATPAPGEAETLLLQRHVDFDLAGGRHLVRLAPARRTVERVFAPLKRAEADALLRSPLLAGDAIPSLWLAEDGRIEEVHLDGAPVIRALGFGLVELHIRHQATDSIDLSLYEEEEEG